MAMVGVSRLGMGWQALALVAPGVGLEVPTGHGVGMVFPVPASYESAGAGMQAPAPVAPVSGL